MNAEKKIESLVQRLAAEVAQLIRDERRLLVGRIVSELGEPDQPMPSRAAHSTSPSIDVPSKPLPATENGAAPTATTVKSERGAQPPPAGAPRKEVLTFYLQQHKGQVAAAARAMGCSRGAFHRWMTELGMAPKEFRTLSRDNVVAQLKLHHGNVSNAAKALGCTRGALHRWLRRSGIQVASFRAEKTRSRDKRPLRQRREQIATHLRRHEGNVSLAAKAMGCSRGALHRWIKEAGITTADFRPAD